MDPVTILAIAGAAILMAFAAWTAVWVRRGMAAKPKIKALEARINELESQAGRHMEALPTRDDFREFGTR